MNAVERSRRTKKVDLIVIDDDDSSSSPAKEEEGIQSDGESVPLPLSPSPEVIELREQNAKLERMFQRACLAAREAELRAERAENLLDTKRGVVESAEKQFDCRMEENMAEMAAQLEEANRRAETHEIDLTRERDALKDEVEVMKRNILSMRERSSELFGRVTALTQQLEEEREVSKELRAVDRVKMAEMAEQVEEANRRAETATDNDFELTRERDALKEEVEVMRRNSLSMREKNSELAGRVTALTRQLEQERALSDELRVVYRERIDDLSEQLAESDRVAKQYEIASKSVRQDLLAPPPEKIARMEERGGVEEEVADKVAQAMLNLPPRFPVRRSTPPREDVNIEQLSREKERETGRLSWSEFEKEMRMCGQTDSSGEHLMGLLLGREKPAYRGDEHASIESVAKLLGLAKDLRRSDVYELNSIVKLSNQFVCFCGANIQSEIALLNHFNAVKHIRNRSYPVYQSDVDFWIDSIEEIKKVVPERRLNCKWQNDLFEGLKTLAPPKIERIERSELFEKDLQEPATPYTLQYTLDGEEWRSISESEALVEYSNFEIFSTTLFRLGDDGTPITLGNLMKMNGEENPFAVFPEASFSKKETRKRPHEESDIEVLVNEAGLGPLLLPWVEFEREMRGQKRGEAGPRVLGLLLGRETPAHEGEEHASFSSVQKLLKISSTLRRRTGGFELNTIMKQSKFVCICGAKIVNAITMLGHFNSKKHTRMRSHPVYQSDVDYWIDTIEDINNRDFVDWPC